MKETGSIFTTVELEHIRSQLMDYYGTAASSFLMARVDILRVEGMTQQELVEEGRKLGIIG